jgi:hypothetical protein
VAVREHDNVVALEVAAALKRFRAIYARLDEGHAQRSEWKHLEYALVAHFVQTQRGLIKAHGAMLGRLREESTPRSRDRTAATSLFEGMGVLHELLQQVQKRLLALDDRRPA